MELRFHHVMVLVVLLGLPVIMLSAILGVGGWQGFGYGAIVGACNVLFILLLIHWAR